MKHLFLKYGWLPALLLLCSCNDEPVYPEAPAITFSTISQQQKQDALGNQVIEVKIAINFKDGDGNLGLGPADTLAPFNDVPGNKYRHNYYVQPFKETQGEFKPYTPFIPYDGRFLRLAPDNSPRTLEGELRYTFTILRGFDLKNGDMLKFKIQIVDRSLNLSNTIETDPITLQF